MPAYLRMLVLPLASGVLYWLSSPAFLFPHAVWFCLVPLGLALWGASAREGLAAGFMYGFLFWLLAAWPIKIQLTGMVGLGSWPAWICTIFFAAFHALPCAFFGYLAGQFRLMETPAGAWWAAGALVVLRSWYPHIFPGSEAHNLYAQTLVIQILDLGGVPILLFFVYFINFQFVRAILSRREARSPAPALIYVFLAFLLLTGYGVYCLHFLHREMSLSQSVRHLTVVSVQPNVPVTRMSRDVPPDDRKNDMKTALAYARKAARMHAGSGLVVLPEIPFPYDCKTEAASDIPALAVESDNAFMLTCLSKTGESRYNSVAFFDRAGIMGKEYRKLLLVPFGEYLPLEKQFPALRRIFPGVMNFSPGNHAEVLYPLDDGILLIPSLCYEAIFTDHTRRFVEKGGNVLINMVNDGWFGNTKASLIHLSLATFRAVEYRIPLVRVTNSGIGVFVQPTGEIVSGSRTPLFQKAVTVHALSIPSGRSPFARWGNVFLFGLTIWFIVGLLWYSRRQRRLIKKGAQSREQN